MKHINNIVRRCIFADDYGNIDFDFVTLAKIQPKLTFDERYLDPRFRQTTETPFKEIRLLTHHVPVNVENPESQYEKLRKELLETYKNILRQLQPDQKYLCCASAGSDTRILCALLAQLRDEEGLSLDNILFHCWGRPELESFRLLMDRLGLKNISVLDDRRPDTFDVGTDEYSTQGWYGYDGQMNFWGEKINPKEYILMGGAGGDVCFYPSLNWWHQNLYFSKRGESISHLCKIFKDIFFPLFEQEMLAAIASIPTKFKLEKDPRINREKLRTDLCFDLGMGDIPMPAPNPRYLFNLSNERKQLMRDLYEKSKFKKEYKIAINYDKVFAEYGCYDAKLWCFACTVYEKIFS